MATNEESLLVFAFVKFYLYHQQIVRFNVSGEICWNSMIKQLVSKATTNWHKVYMASVALLFMQNRREVWLKALK